MVKFLRCVLREKVKLTVRGGRNPTTGRFQWGDAIVDAGIMAALTFFTSLGGMSAVGLPSPDTVYGAGIAGATQFFLILALKRGLVKK